MSKKKRKKVTGQWFEIVENDLVESTVDPIKLGEELARIYMGTATNLDESALLKLRKKLERTLGRSTPEAF